MSKSNKVVVVEGYHDLAKLKSIYPNMDVVITNGSEISRQTLDELKILNEQRGLILFLDPDFPGKKIRQTINDYVGATTHAYLPKDKCISKNNKKVGIEHALQEDIINALNNLFDSKIEYEEIIKMSDLYYYELTGCRNAKKNREKLTKNIGIGLSNSKTLHKKLNMFEITKKQIEDILRK